MVGLMAVMMVEQLAGLKDEWMVVMMAVKMVGSLVVTMVVQ